MSVEVKSIGRIQYIIFQWSNVMWGWSKGIYGVHPDYEQEFIDYIKKHKLYK